MALKIKTGTVLTADIWGRRAKGRETKRERERDMNSFFFLSKALPKPAYYETHCCEAVRYFYHYAEFHSRILFVTIFTSGKITAKWVSDIILNCSDLEKL